MSHFLRKSQASLVAQRVKNLPAMQETQIGSLGREDPPEKGMATHSSTLAWRIPRQRSLVGHSPQVHKEMDATEQLTLSFSYGKVKQNFSLKNSEFAVNWEIPAVRLDAQVFTLPLQVCVLNDRRDNTSRILSLDDQSTHSTRPGRTRHYTSPHLALKTQDLQTDSALLILK